MTCLAPRSVRDGNTDGFIVVAVLWILGALATLATIYAIYVTDTAVAFTVHDERLQAEAMVTAGLELTAYQLAVPLESQPTRGTFTFRLGRANIAVDYRSEAARIDLNAAPKELLSGLFTTLGARRDEADYFADRIIGWRLPPTENGDAEASAYRTAGLRYQPRGGPFAQVDELALVMGLPALMIERATPFLTVYSGKAQINVMEAAPQVIAALPGMTPDRLQSILAQRAATPQNGDVVSALLGPSQSSATAEGAKSTRVAIRVVFDNGHQAASEVVILRLDEGPEPYRVLSWRDLLDEMDQRPKTGVQ
jgi:general secretion pathway protein K